MGFRCPFCGRRVTGGRWIHPKNIRLTKKAEPDILPGDGINGYFLVSENFMQKYKESGLTGILSFDKIDEVNPSRKGGVVKNNYYSVEIARSMIAINLEKCDISFGNIDESKICPQCNPAGATMDFIRKLAFNMENDEGYDIFRIYGMGEAVFFSERFIRFCEEEKISNLSYLKLDEPDPWMDTLFGDDDLSFLFE